MARKGVVTRAVGIRDNPKKKPSHRPGYQKGGAVYEGSKEDIAEDARGAKKRGVSMRQYERSAQDRAEDRRGQARLEKKK